MKATIFLIFIITILFTGANFPQQKMDKVRIGTFDSRCIAIAYARSDGFRKEIDSMKVEHKKATEEGNTQLAEKLEQLGQTKQFLAHQQGFSNASINNILSNFKDIFPSIAKSNDLKMILSKWEILFVDESFELVDITNQLVEFFTPNEETKEILEKVKSMDPIPIEEISK